MNSREVFEDSMRDKFARAACTAILSQSTMFSLQPGAVVCMCDVAEQLILEHVLLQGRDSRVQ